MVRSDVTTAPRSNAPGNRWNVELSITNMTDTKGGNLGISWHDSAWIPILNPGNIMDYFSEKSNPFYDRTCNNEIVKMQRLNPEQLNNLTGVEYVLLHVQDPILYVIRKQHRHSPTQVTPLSDYYIIAGVVYQAPDLGSVINSRSLSTAHHLQTAFDEALSFSRYHPSKGYWWEFKDNVQPDTKKKTKESTKMEMSSVFQRQRVDVLLAELAKKFPPKLAPQPPPQPTEKTSTATEEPKPVEPKVEVKQEKTETSQGTNVLPAATVTSPVASSTGPPKSTTGTVKPPLEKRPRLMA